MFQDETRSTVWEEMRQRSMRQFSHLLTTEVPTAAARKAGIEVGNHVLNTLRLTWLAVEAALRIERSFLAILGLVVMALRDQECYRDDPLFQRKRQSGRKSGTHKKRDIVLFLGTQKEGHCAFLDTKRGTLCFFDTKRGTLCFFAVVGMDYGRIVAAPNGEDCGGRS